MPYNIKYRQGEAEYQERRKPDHQGKEVDGMAQTECEVDRSNVEAMKKLLEAIEAALASDSVEKITLVIKPKRKPKQS